MTRRHLAVALTAGVLVLCGLAVPARAATSALDVLSVDPSGAQVTAVVAPPPTLAGQDLTHATWRVTEQGHDVAVRIEPVSNEHLEVALALDTSGSMAGAPMDAAKAAAETFVAGLPPSARVAVVAFSSKPVVVVPMTTDRPSVVAAVRGLRAQGETALYDAVTTASGLFSKAGDARKELVVLSDGGDTVSATKEADAIASLTSAHVTGYVASLVTKDTATNVLDELARRSGGRVVAATDVTAIRSVFGDIGTALTHQYRLSFPPTGVGQTSVSLSVTAGGATATADRLVDLPVHATPTTLPAPRVMRATDQAWMRVAGIGSFALGILLLSLYVFVPRRKRRITSRWIADHALTSPGDSSLHDLTHRATDLAERSLRRRGWAARIDLALERAGVPLRPGEFALVVVGVVFGAWLVGTVLLGPLLGIGFAIGAAFLARTFLRFKVARRRRHFEEQLGDTLQLLSGSLRAGYGLAQALDAVARNADSPTAEEFGRLIMETRVGRSLPEALMALATRLGSQDFDWVVEAITINREIGGDLTELLDQAGKTIREREDVRRQIKSLSAEGRLSAFVLMAIPIGLFLYMHVANPDYVGELTASPVGWAMLGAAAGMMTFGGLWMRKLVQVVF